MSSRTLTPPSPPPALPPLAPALGLALALALAPACSGPRLEPAFVEALLLAPPGQPSLMVLQGERVTGCGAAVAMTDLPDAVRRAAEHIQATSRSQRALREWGAHGVGYRVITIHDVGGKQQRRSVLLSPDGQQLWERSHEIPESDAPARALETATGLGLGTVMRVEVVQGTPNSQDRYRFLLKDQAGVMTQAECLADGSDLSQARLVSAEWSVGRSH